MRLVRSRGNRGDGVGGVKSISTGGVTGASNFGDSSPISRIGTVVGSDGSAAVASGDGRLDPGATVASGRRGAGGATGLANGLTSGCNGSSSALKRIRALWRRASLVFRGEQTTHKRACRSRTSYEG